MEISSGEIVQENALSILSQNLHGEMLVYGVVGLLAAVWLWSIIWVSRDIAARTSNGFLQIFSILLVTLLTPLVGLPLYFLIRPVFYKLDNNGRRQALVVNVISCGNCGRKNATHHDFCIYCGEGLKIGCKNCNNPYPFSYEYCPHCGAPNIEI